MAFILGILVGAAAVLAVIGLTLVIKYDAYRKGYYDGMQDGKDNMETKIFKWREEDDRK